jgi:hypothetical protein
MWLDRTLRPFVIPANLEARCGPTCHDGATSASSLAPAAAATDAASSACSPPRRGTPHTYGPDRVAFNRSYQDRVEADTGASHSDGRMLGTAIGAGS